MTYLFYTLLLMLYLPGFMYIRRHSYTGGLPVVMFLFVGMFVFGALGSIMVMTREYGYFGTLFSYDYLGMLLMQPLMFYLVAGPYVLAKRGMSTILAPVFADRYLAAILVPIILLILYLYAKDAGGFLIVDLLRGDMNQENVLEFRQNTYGLAAYPYYRLGFLVLPAILAAHTLLAGLSIGRLTRMQKVILVFCLSPSLLLADKAGIMYMLIVIVIAYSIHIAASGRPVLSVLNRKVVLVLLTGIGITSILYSFYNSGSGKTIFEYGNLLLFRIFGAYSEAIAATVPYVGEYGQLSGLSLPDLKGLLSHDRLNLEASLHYYMTHWSLETDFRNLPGNVLIPAVAEGYANFGWPGFLLFVLLMNIAVVIAQEFFLRIRMGVLSYALMAWYGYLAVTMSMTSIFSTYISFIHTAVAGGIILLWLVLRLLGRFMLPNRTDTETPAV